MVLIKKQRGGYQYSKSRKSTRSMKTKKGKSSRSKASRSKTSRSISKRILKVKRGGRTTRRR